MVGRTRGFAVAVCVGAWGALGGAACLEERAGRLEAPDEAWCDDWGRWECARLRCLRGPEHGLDAACEAHYEGLCREALEPFVAERERAGAAVVDHAAVVECLAAQADQPCGEGVTLGDRAPRSEACRRMVAGAGEVGAACLLDLECRDGLRCVSDGACPGTCSEPAPLGADCSARPCAEDLHCDLHTATCEPSPAPGYACGEPCPADTWCDSLDTGTCRPRRPRDAACTSLLACREGLTCRFEPDGGGVCRPPGALGERCASGLGGLGGLGGYASSCEAGLVCWEEVCVEPPTEVGEACLGGQCFASGLGCRPSTGTCEPIPGLGEACERPPEDVGLLASRQPACAWGWCDAAADATAGVCRAPRALGDPCVEGAECGGAGCVDGRCALEERHGCGGLWHHIPYLVPLEYTIR